MTSVNDWNLIRIIRGVFKNIAILCFWGLSEGPLFLELQGTDSLDTDMWHKFMNADYELNISNSLGVREANIHAYRQRDDILRITFS
jgi:hypothetical protein